MRSDIARQFEALADVARDADLILGASLHCAGLSYAEKLGIPYAYVCYTPSLLPSALHPSPTCPHLGLPRWLNRLTWWLNDRFWNLLYRGSINRERGRLGLPPVSNAFRHVLSAPLVLASEPRLGLPPPDSPFVAVQTGAWFLPAPEPLEPTLAAFLAAGPPPVYVGFGSMADRHAACTTAVVIAAARAAGLRVVIGGGWANLGDAARDPDVHVVPSVPHDKLFPHLCAVVHHGGAGTTAAAARAGIPQVVIPHFLDQFFWADRVRTLGLGPTPVPRTKLTARRLTAALRACLGEPAFRERARAFAPTMVQDGLERGVRAVEAIGGRTGLWTRPPQRPAETARGVFTG
jgi:UDP:flavonoid glycosyltransferase YjiC (YdhE family)